jgi:uncharacterized membrane protein YbhN (UPF0104 family)
MLVWVLRIAVLVVVCFAVHRTVQNALGQLSEYDWHVKPGWIVLSGLMYALGLVPMGWFWGRALAAMQCPAPLLPTLRAYFLGHLGKYVPGKAMAVVLRVAAVRRWVPSMRVAFISVLLETLTMMAVGGALAAVISVAIGSDKLISLIALGMALAAGVPTLPPVVRWLARLGVGRFKQEQDDDVAKPQAVGAGDIDDKLNGISFGLLAEGWGAASVCWILLGASLWAMLRAIGVADLHFVSDLPVLIAAAAFSVVAGFLSMLPGGILVRDAALMQLLAPICGDANALVAAVLMRLVWLVSEVVACGILYVVGDVRGRRSEVGDQGIQKGR